MMNEEKDTGSWSSVQVDGTNTKLDIKKTNTNCNQGNIATRAVLPRVVSLTMLSVIIAALVTIHSVESTTTFLSSTPSNQLPRPSATTSSALTADSLLLKNPSSPPKSATSSDGSEVENLAEQHHQAHLTSSSSSSVYDNDANNNHVFVIGHINQQRDHSTLESNSLQPGQSTSSINLEAGQEFEPSTGSGLVETRSAGLEQFESMVKKHQRQQSKQQDPLIASEGSDGTNQVATAAPGGGPLENFDDDNYGTGSGQNTKQQPIIERRFGLFKKSQHSSNSLPPYMNQAVLAHPSEDCERCFMSAGLATQQSNNWFLDAQYRQPIASPPMIAPGMMPISGYMSPLKSYNFPGRYKMPLSGRAPYRMPVQSVNCLQPGIVRNGGSMLVGPVVANQEHIESGIKSYSAANQQY